MLYSQPPHYGKRKPGSLTASAPGDTLYFAFASYNDSGDSEALSGLAVTDIEVFKNGDPTARATDSGISLISDTGQVGDRAGLYRFSLQLFNTADDTGHYDVGSWYQVAVDSVTIDGKTVRMWVGSFEIDEPLDTGDVCNAVWDTINSAHTGAGSFGEAQAQASLYAYYAYTYMVDTGTVSNAVWNSVRANHTAAGSFGASDTGINSRLDVILADTDTGIQSGVNVVQLVGDTGAASQLQQAFLTTPTYWQQVDVQQVDGDTGAADQLQKAFADGFADTGLNERLDYIQTLLTTTGVNVSQLVGDTGYASRIGKFASLLTDAGQIDTGTGLADTGTIAAAVWDELLTGSSHNIATSAGRRLREAYGLAAYALAAVWVDEVGGTSTGTESYEDGTVTNRSDDLDNALVIAAALGLDKIHIQTNNHITLTAPLSGYEVHGAGYTMSFGGQAVTDVTIIGAELSGIATGDTGSDNIFVECIIGDTGITEIPPARFLTSGFKNTVVLGDTGEYRLIDCFSAVAGTGSALIDIGGDGNRTIEFRRWSGGLNLKGVTSGDEVSINVVSGGIVQIGGTGGTVVVTGMNDVIDTGASGVSITSTAVLNQAYIAGAVWDELDTGHSDTGTYGRLRQGVNVSKLSDTGSVSRAVWDSLRADHSTAATFGHDLADTGSVSNAVWNSLRASHTTAATFGHDLADSGEIAAATWAYSARALTAFSHDTGVASTVWGYAGRKLAVDTGIGEQVWATVKTGNMDTGTFGEELGGGVHVIKITDTGINSRFSQVTVTGFSDTGINSRLDVILADTDTGIQSSVNATSINDTGLESRFTAIQNKTDSLTFTVSGQVDANVQSVNDVTVQGTGVSGNEWRP